MTELISKNIRAQRLAQGMTQEELAAKVFTTRQSISNYETGKSKPDYETIGKIAMALGVSAETLLYDSDDHRKKVKAWCMLVAVLFFFALARSISLSTLLISNDSVPSEYLTYIQGYTTVLVPAVCSSSGWILVRLYELYIRKDKLCANHAKVILILLVLFLSMWFFVAFLELPKIYEAASDPMKNKHGGPAMLSIYLETFYYKYIYHMMSQLPILNGIFVFLGGCAAICKNGERT